ncbi:hypothetical protein B4135_2108 [Caldibacillus debilis]|uniref:Uncharacterized protein n=1 Tax=Caldibacillus debilis TaxID=301148 RepID=A0A150M3K9_9BACI|nr:hypothetical protein B4135_2108 [Caldibacillus debilis]
MLLFSLRHILCEKRGRVWGKHPWTGGKKIRKKFECVPFYGIFSFVTFRLPLYYQKFGSCFRK